LKSKEFRISAMETKYMGVTLVKWWEEMSI